MLDTYACARAHTHTHTPKLSFPSQLYKNEPAESKTSAWKLIDHLLLSQLIDVSCMLWFAYIEITIMCEASITFWLYNKGNNS